MVAAATVPLVEREVRERLSAAAIELLFEHARVFAEGGRARGPTGKQAFFGSVMLTIELDTVAPLVRETPSSDLCARLAELMERDARVRTRLRTLAEAEVSKLAGAPVRVHSADVRVRADLAARRLLVDVEVAEG
jgi:hypothetical protein